MSGSGLSAAAGPAPRREDLDVLRLVAVLMLFVFHTAKVFDANPAYHVKSETTVAAATALTWWIRQWQMPLLFLISGWASATAAARAARSRFLRRRVARLVPPLVVGVVVLCPPIKWLELAGGRTLRPSGLRLVEPVRVSPGELIELFFGRLDHFTWSHLWFLVYLLSFTVLALPLLTRARSDAHAAAPLRPDRDGAAAAPRPGAAPIALLPIPALALIEATLRPRWGDHPNLYADWASVSLLLAHFALGVLLARSPGFERSLRGSRRWLAGVLLLATIAAPLVDPPAARAALGAAVGWSAVGWAIAAAPTVPWPRPLRRPALQRSALAIYVLHHTPLLLIAWWTVGTALPVAVQALVIAAGAAAITALLVALAARARATRRLFGLDGLVRAPAARPLRH